MTSTENGASSRLLKYQFRLRYLFYLVTLTAIGSTVLRYVFDLSVDIVFRSVISVYVVLLIAYLAFRFPILLRRLRHNRRKLQSNRTELADFANQVRRQKSSDR